MKRPTFDDLKGTDMGFVGPPEPAQIPKLTAPGDREAVEKLYREELAARIAAETEAYRSVERG